MKKLFIVPALAALLSCSKDKAISTGSEIPSCIMQRIEQLKAAAPADPRAEVWKYEYNSKTVYYIPPACCDQLSELYDDQCNLLCHPDGGLTGQGDGQCSDFTSSRTNGVLVWKDQR